MTIGATLLDPAGARPRCAIYVLGRMATPWAEAGASRMIDMLLGQAAVPRDIGVFEFLFGAEYWTGERRHPHVALGHRRAVVRRSSWSPASSRSRWPRMLAHFGRGELSVTWIVTASRAIPTFAIAGLLVPISLRNGWGFEPWPIFIALLLLALPPIYLNTYTAVRDVDRAAVDAARAMGFTERSVLLRVELALATSVILAGIRVAACTVVATEPIRPSSAAMVSVVSFATASARTTTTCSSPAPFSSPGWRA